METEKVVSAIERSADDWSNVGRKAANLAMDATEKGSFGTALEHRITARMAFEMEQKLREMTGAER